MVDGSAGPARGIPRVATARAPAVFDQAEQPGFEDLDVPVRPGRQRLRRVGASWSAADSRPPSVAGRPVSRSARASATAIAGAAGR